MANATKKLTSAQQRMMDELRQHGSSESPCGMGRRSAAAASAWHRTANSLQAMGLVCVVRTGDVYTARLAKGGAS